MILRYPKSQWGHLNRFLLRPADVRIEIYEMTHVPQLRDALSRAKVAKGGFDLGMRNLEFEKREGRRGRLVIGDLGLGIWDWRLGIGYWRFETGDWGTDCSRKGRKGGRGERRRTRYRG